MRKLRVADLYCGGGGTSQGAEQSGAAKVLCAVNHWNVAIETHSANFPNALHINSRLDQVNPSECPKIDLLFASPECVHHSRARGGRPTSDQQRSGAWDIMRWVEFHRPSHLIVENVQEFCFPAKTIVVTKRGLVPISEVRIGDEVMTHNNRWRSVTATKESRKPTVSVKGYGNAIVECTADHKFYAREVAVDIHSGTRHDRRLLEPTWIEARDLTRNENGTAYDRQYSGYAWACPRKMPLRAYRPPECKVDTSTKPFFYMLGRWLGDGWIRKRKGSRTNQITICANATTDEADILESKLADLNIQIGRWVHTDSVDVFVWTDKRLEKWIVNNFCQYADRKTVPIWMYSISEELRRSFIDGWHDSDGCDGSGTMKSITTVSRSAAVGLKLLLEQMGIACGISKTDARELPSINDAEKMMSCKDAYQVHWRSETEWSKHVDSDLHRWGRVRTVTPCSDSEKVYDITVDGDHSFIADGQVVHNCSWGPVGDNGRPLKRYEGKFFDAWLMAIQAAGYRVEHRLLNAADYGAATSRTRLFIVARKGNRSIHWPEPTHAKVAGGELPGMEMKPWRSAAEIIDWRIPCPSVFLRKRPLKDNTLLRIEAGLRKFVEPFVVELRRNMTARSGGDPISTVTAGGGHHAVAVPCRIDTNHGETGRSPGGRIHAVGAPMGAATSVRGEAIALPIVCSTHWGGEYQGSGRPCPTIRTRNGAVVAVPYILPRQGYYDSQTLKRCREASEPLNTITASHVPGGVVVPFLSAFHNGPDGSNRNYPLNESLPTLDTQNRYAVAVPFVVTYYANGKPYPVTDPICTISTRDRCGVALAIIEAAGSVEPRSDGERKLIATMAELGVADIGFRMLDNSELARATGFPSEYIFCGNKGDVTKQIGNAVVPNVAQALTEAVAA